MNQRQHFLPFVKDTARASSYSVNTAARRELSSSSPVLVRPVENTLSRLPRVEPSVRPRKKGVNNGHDSFIR